jgi:hypothetical protein
MKKFCNRIFSIYLAILVHKRCAKEKNTKKTIVYKTYNYKHYINIITYII